MSLGLRLQDADFLEPALDERRPCHNRVLGVPQTVGMTALREEVDLCWDFCGVEHTSIDRAVADVVDGIVPRLQQEGRRRPTGNMDARIERVARAAEMARIDRDREIRPTADPVQTKRRGWQRRTTRDSVSKSTRRRS